MSLYDENKNEVEELLALSDMTDLDQLLDWTKFHWKFLAIGAAMLVHTIVFVGIIIAGNTKNSSDAVLSDKVPPPASQPVLASVEAPTSQIEEIEEVVKEPVEEPAKQKEESNEESKDDPAYEMAFEIGVQTGVAFNETREALVRFWHGFDEATGASDWAKDKLDSGIERVNEWLDERDERDESDESDEPSSEVP